MLVLYYQTKIGIPNSIPYHLRNDETENFVSVRPFFITEICQYLKIPYKETDKESWSNEIAYYHIEIDWIDPAMIYQNVFSWIDKDVLEIIKAPEKNLRLLIWFPNEGFSLSMPRFIDIIDFCLKDLNIPPNKVYFVFGDINVATNYNIWKSKLGLEDIHVFGFDSFESSYHNECRMILNSQFKNSFITKKQYKSSLNQHREKIFIFKNSNPRKHRIYFAAELKFRKLLDQSYYSWINRYYKPFLTFDIVNEFYQGKDSKEIFNNMLIFLKNSPYILDYDSNNIGNWLNQRLLIKEHFMNSYFSFVTETTYEDCYTENVLFVTEKVYQSIIQYHPFIVAAGIGFLKHMKAYGYKTFPELFDETYDDEPDKKIRSKMILDNIEKVCKMPKEQLHEIYYDKSFQKKLIHNRNLFVNTKGKIKWEEVIKWLTTN